ncbi:protoporphyrinogen oxidase HemJ [Aureimonas altamirensis]|uniref:protoporphyrinogen oxidase HemJ n=1 Tax=Aureimonas altamirensis TaxID=370622 RepID=UPI0020369848|nr:protoporphyrinogen oxidase HemJ [Aureimonas altamirensis]MCM2505749.1 protoporphyrinogen oxidase HemJ [Aureimonas altamirensis]
MKSNRALWIALAVGALLLIALFALVPPEAMPWVKSLHIVAVISWMAGMLYLPRLFVYHAESAVGSQQAETFKIMERRLLKGIVNPAMVVTWAAGLWLAWMFSFQGGWLHAKIALVLVLSGMHGYLSASQRRFERDENRKSAKFWRSVNEIPAVLMVLIVILVVVKPF